MKFNLLVWCIHSCRRDVFLEELGKGKLPNFQELIDRGLFLSSAIVGEHDHTSFNFYPNVSRSFAFLTGPETGRTLLLSRPPAALHAGVVRTISSFPLSSVRALAP